MRRFRPGDAGWWWSCGYGAGSATSPGAVGRTFAEQVEGLTIPYGRFSAGLRGRRAVGWALAGRAGARLLAALGESVSRMTLLRLVRAVPDQPPTAVPEVVGVDEFAVKKGHICAAVIIDAQTHRPIEVLPDRSAEVFAAWLEEHPRVRVICRYRTAGFGEDEVERPRRVDLVGARHP